MGQNRAAGRHYWLFCCPPSGKRGNSSTPCSADRDGWHHVRGLTIAKHSRVDMVVVRCRRWPPAYWEAAVRGNGEIHGVEPDRCQTSLAIGHMIAGTVDFALGNVAMLLAQPGSLAVR